MITAFPFLTRWVSGGPIGMGESCRQGCIITASPPCGRSIITVHYPHPLSPPIIHLLAFINRQTAETRSLAAWIPRSARAPSLGLPPLRVSIITCALSVSYFSPNLRPPLPPPPPPEPSMKKPSVLKKKKKNMSVILKRRRETVNGVDFVNRAELTSCCQEMTLFLDVRVQVIRITPLPPLNLPLLYFNCINILKKRHNTGKKPREKTSLFKQENVSWVSVFTCLSLVIKYSFC